MNWKSLTTENSTIMKGIAILMIATHNFMHLFPLPKENEFDFSFARTQSMLNLLWTEPENIIRVLLSFFGHYGVAVFIFLSAYGLTKKHASKTINFWQLICEQIFKIFPAFIIAIMIWLMLEGFYSYGIFGPIKMLYWNFTDIVLKLTLVSNFIAGQGLKPIGPWWFIPFIFQFYIVFPYLLKAYDRWQEISLMTFSVFCLVFSGMVEGNIEGVNLYYTIIPYIPVFSLGIFMAKKDTIKQITMSPILILSTLIVFVLSNLNQYFWLLSNISFIILFLVLLNVTLPKIKGTSYRFLKFTGQISMSLFLVNGFLRYPLLRWAVEANNWLITLVYCSIFLVISFSVALLLNYLTNLMYIIIKTKSWPIKSDFMSLNSIKG